MVGSTSALSYQMMLEDKLLHAMINAEMRSAFRTACEYAKVYCIFVGCPRLPDGEPLNLKSMGENHEEWARYYFKLMGTWGKQISENLIRIRKQYREKNSDIPDIKRSEAN